jgi:endonuclease/exonuclease/phosphatase family metal-dependent hydrolase
MGLAVLTWNLKHGRAVPSAGRDLFEEFADELGGWRWDVALLQEVPPWWPAALASRLGCDQRLVLTSRNFLLPIRRAIAVRWPDLIKSNAGGCNAILARRAAVLAHRTRRLSVLPERRWVHGVRLTEPPGVWFCNVHTEANAAQGRLAAATALGWADGAPAVLGGDFNGRGLTLNGWRRVGGYGVDQVFARELEPVGDKEVLARGRLSDHAPVLVEVR